MTRSPSSSLLHYYYLAAFDSLKQAGYPVCHIYLVIATVSGHGQCLSTEYLSVHKPLEWQCVIGHRFTALLTFFKMKGGF